MARYRITDLCYLDERLVQPGEDVDIADDVIPGPHMSPKDDAARRAVKAAAARMVKIDPVEAMTTPMVG